MARVKLTLNVEEKVIKNAREFLQKRKISISQAVEHYLERLGKEKKYLVDEWVGIAADTDSAADYKKTIREKVKQKHAAK